MPLPFAAATAPPSQRAQTPSYAATLLRGELRIPGPATLPLSIAAAKPTAASWAVQISTTPSTTTESATATNLAKPAASAALAATALAAAKSAPGRTEPAAATISAVSSSVQGAVVLLPKPATSAAETESAATSSTAAVAVAAAVADSAAATTTRTVQTGIATAVASLRPACNATEASARRCHLLRLLSSSTRWSPQESAAAVATAANLPAASLHASVRDLTRWLEQSVGCAPASRLPTATGFAAASKPAASKPASSMAWIGQQKTALREGFVRLPVLGKRQISCRQPRANRIGAQESIQHACEGGCVLRRNKSGCPAAQDILPALPGI